MGSAAGIDIPRAGLRPSRRLLRLAGDDRLVQQIRRGSEAAFEVAFERHSPAILGFCRHMLGSREEAEDAVQHTFAAAFSDLQRNAERQIALKPWLFTIARNRCLSVLRARREHAEELELVTEGLADQVEQRAELRQLLADVRDLPEEQREALLLAEVGGLPQAEIAGVLGCEVGRVKGLVYRARSSLVARREARALACNDVREQLANLRGGSLRRNELRLHLRDCEGCRDFREQVRRQRRLLSVALPVAPTLGLKANVLAAVGIGGGAAAGGAVVAGGTAGGAVGAGGAAKFAAVAALALGGVSGGAVVVSSQHHHAHPSKPEPTPAAVAPTGQSAPAAQQPAAPARHGELQQAGASKGGHGNDGASGESHHGRGHEGGKAQNEHQRGERERESGGRAEHGDNAGIAPPAEDKQDKQDKHGKSGERDDLEHESKAPKVEEHGSGGQDEHLGNGQSKDDGSDQEEADG